MEFRHRVTFNLNNKKLSDNGIQVSSSSDLHSKNSQIMPPLNGLNDILLDQFYENTKYFLLNMQKSNYSPLKNELCDQARTRALFQSKVFGKTSQNFDILPQCAFSSFSVSLRLVIQHNSFSFFSVISGFEIHENFEDHGQTILDFISHGTLPPRTLDDVKKLNLTWYDGGLICEVEDKRRKELNSMRILLRVHPLDVAKYGPDSECEYLLARYPLLSFEPDVQISRLSRTVYNDKIRWKTNEPELPTAKQFVQREFPEMFIEKEQTKESVTEEHVDFNSEELRAKLAMLAE